MVGILAGYLASYLYAEQASRAVQLIAFFCHACVLCHTSPVICYEVSHSRVLCVARYI